MKLIPMNLLAVVADLTSWSETHASLDSLYLYAGAFGDPPLGSKATKAQQWLMNTNKNHEQPLTVVGKILEK